MKKSDIHLFVDTQDESNKNALTNIYSKTYGFTENSLDDTTVCPSNGAVSSYMTMKKPSLVEDTTAINFSFLMKRKGGGRRKTRNVKNKLSYKKKTVKRNKK
jgi:hypothetical protein